MITKKIDFFKLIIALAIPQLAAFLGTLATTPSINSWYLNLTKPSFNPPNWIFGPVWTVLFLLMGFALYLVWVSEPKKFQWFKKGEAKQFAYLFFSLQLIFNVLWSYLFFVLHNPLAAFIEIVFLWVFILLNIIVFYRVNKFAAWLLIPYILWVSFATVLNYNIFVLN